MNVFKSHDRYGVGRSHLRAAVKETATTTEEVSAAVAIVAGQQTRDQYLLDRSSFEMDEFLLPDLAASYAEGWTNRGRIWRGARGR